MKVLLATGALMSVLTGCSVKEDRRVCPCEIIFSAGEGVTLDRDGSFFMAVYESSVREQVSEYSWRQVKTGDYACSVKRGFKQICVLDGLDRSFMYGTGWNIIPGNQADSIYVSVVDLDCSGDEAVMPLAPAKQFSTVFLSVAGATGDYPYEFTVEGDISGLDLLSLEPLRGVFRYALQPWDGNRAEYRFRLPRQFPDDPESLVLKMTHRQGTGSILPGTAAELPLGEMIRDAGYDWTAPDLDDIHISIGHAEIGLELTVNDWMTIWEGDFVI